MKRRGFTIVEIVIVITIMGILLTLAVVNLNSTQVDARDAERKSDAESIAISLEAYYRNASTESTAVPGTYISKVYPATTTLASIATFRSAFPDVDTKIIRTPNAPETQEISLVAATTNASFVQPAPSEGNDVYVYQPLRGDGSLCTSHIENNPCRTFKLYYYQETTGSTEVIASKGQ